MRSVNAAIFGLGWWGRKMVHLLSTAESSGLRLVRAVEPDVQAAVGFAREHGLTLSADEASAIDDPDIEAIVLATPHSLHEAQIERAAAAGKHVFCEKPLAMTRAGAEHAVGLCRSAGVILGMGHERRFEPPIADLIAQADDGRLGRIQQVEANFSHDKFVSLAAGNWRLDPAQAPAGGMTATGIHLTDLAVRLLGPARDVRVSCEQLASSIPQGDTMSAHIRFARGGTAYISASLAMPFVSRFAVYGSKGWIEVRDKAHVEAPAGWVVTRAYAGGSIETFELPPAEAVRDNLQAFARAVRGEADYPITGEEMVANIALLQAIVQGASSGRIERVS